MAHGLEHQRSYRESSVEMMEVGGKTPSHTCDQVLGMRLPSRSSFFCGVLSDPASCAHLGTESEIKELEDRAQ